MQGLKGKYIKQVRLMGSKQYQPCKYFSSYDFLEQFNNAAKKRYDLEAIEVRYIISKSKAMKDIDDHTSLTSLTPQKQFNNIFSIEDDFMKKILKDTVSLVPPQDFDANKFDEENNAAKRMEEDVKNKQIDSALDLLARLQNIPSWKDFKGQLRSIPRFKKQISNLLKQSEVEVYVKVLLSKPTQDKIETDKNSKNPIIINTSSKQQIRVYLHPVKGQGESEDLIANLKPITDWSLCSLNPMIGGRIDGNTYWSVDEIYRKVYEMNQSIKIMSYISIHRNKKKNIDYLEVYTFFFNEIVVKTLVNLAQIKKIEIFSMGKEGTDSQVYLHLAYPPRYYASILKHDVGCDDGFIRSWQRVQNFTFLRNSNIMNNEFLRLFLFNNTILRIRLSRGDLVVDTTPAKQLLIKISEQFKGTIKVEYMSQSYDFGRKLTQLSTSFKYVNFKDKFKMVLLDTFNEDKIWKLKYLILVLVRFNKIFPSEIESILNLIDEHKQDIDIILYIFWQQVAQLNTVSKQGDTSFIDFVKTQIQQIKKLSFSHITKKATSNTDMISYVYKASLTPSGYLYNPPTPEMKGRLMKEYTHRSQHFMRVTITDDNEGTLKNQKYITKVALKQMMQKIPILQRIYIPLGWSPSQLRSYSLWYLHQITKDRSLIREQVLSFLGNFQKIDNPAKKAARIGQSFSASWTFECKVNEIKQVIREDDKSPKGYMYTDGIGKISEDLLQKISLKLQIRDLSVVQVRYKGAKGILVLDQTLPARTIQLRKSMIKYDCNHDSAAKYLDILDWNKYKAGFLNRQTIVLLKSLGIADKVFEKRHNEHIVKISNMSFKDCSIFKHMNEELNTDISNLQPANITILSLLRAGFKLENEPFFRGVLETMKKNGYHQLKMKCNIMIEKSARIIGIIDQWNILQQGQLYCTVLDNISLKPVKQHVEGDVIITRNPCLHPADIRKLKCISNHEATVRFERRGEDNIFLKYVNCVIFPKKGQIPVTSMISGSDLDGDNFWISWDPELIPEKDEPIYVIDAPPTQGDKLSAKPKNLKMQQSYEEMLNFFVEYLNYEKLGQIDNSHLVHADKSPFYAKAKQCMELAVAHGKAVDFPKSGFCPQIDQRLLVSVYPDFMEKQQSPEYISESILGRLYRDIKERIKNLLSDCENHKTGKMDEEILKDLIDENIRYEKGEIREVVNILLAYEGELFSLINLVGVDTQYQIYSGNFSIAKDKVKAFGKNRLIATILALRAKYFDQFFANNTRSEDKDIYTDAKESDLQKMQLFAPVTTKRALLFYACSYVMKYREDGDFFNEQHHKQLRKMILQELDGIRFYSVGKFCGFVWFIVPKIIINQKYRMKKKLSLKNAERNKENMEEQEENREQDEEAI